VLAYNARIATKSLKRNPVLTAIIILGIALGICATTTFTTVRHMFARDPLPGKSDKLFYVRMDNWDPASPYPTGDGGLKNPHPLPPTLSFRDVTELMRSNIPARQTPSYFTILPIYPERRISRPYQDRVRLVASDFFPMFEVPFQYGHGWDKTADAKAEQVIVLDNATNQKLFGGANSVGKRLRVGDRDFTVVGVLAPWRPFIKMYDLMQNFVGDPDPLYIPFSLTRPMQIRNFGNSDGWKAVGPTFDDFLASDVDFIPFWVELPKPADRAAYQQLLDNYVRAEKTKGRFPRPLNNQVTSMHDMMVELGVVRPALTAMAAMSILFLVICALNLTGLLLGKFLARAPEVSVRRALGATRADIFMQHIAECEIVGVAGGILGMLLSLGVLRFIAKLITATSVISLDLEMIVAAIFLSLVAGLIAGLYPAWRICAVQPAVQLKV
jgi:putative ABC transport system permease protein